MVGRNPLVWFLMFYKTSSLGVAKDSFDWTSLPTGFHLRTVALQSIIMRLQWLFLFLFTELFLGSYQVQAAAVFAHFMVYW